MRLRAPAFTEVLVPLLVAAVITFGGVAHSGHARALPLVLGVAPGLSLFARRRASVATLIASGAMTLLVLHLAPAAGATAVFAPAVALYWLALRKGARVRFVAAAAAVVAIVLAEALQSEGPTLLQTLAHALLVAIPLLIADVHRTRHANVALLRERLELAERTRDQEAQRRAEQERLRIARELHDVVAHTLTTINVQASTAAELLDRRPDHVHRALSTIEDASRNALDELRAILGVLRGGEDGDAPLRPAPASMTSPSCWTARATTASTWTSRSSVSARRGCPSRSHWLPIGSCRSRSPTPAGTPRGHPCASRSHFDLTGCAWRSRTPRGLPTRPMGRGVGVGVGIIGMTERAAAIGGAIAARPLPSGFRVDADLPYHR